MTTLFAADIGGTKSELALFPLEGAKIGALRQKRHLNAEFGEIEEIIEKFLAESARKPKIACLAVAGVVDGDRAHLTNLPWKIDCRSLEQQFGFERVILINDLTAVCSSLAVLQPADLMQIQAGSGKPGDVRGVIAPGTGLGEGLSIQFGERQFVQGSEGGHTNFAPVNEEQLALLAWMRKRIQPVSYEMLIAGPGLAHLYDFCRQYHHLSETPRVVEAMHQADDRIPIIVGGALGSIGDGPCPLCLRVIDLFLSILGSEAGNLALKLYARGGIFLGGGILPRLVGQISFDPFMESFLAKGQMSALMKEIPVSLILRKDAALIGAAYLARCALRERSSNGR